MLAASGMGGNMKHVSQPAHPLQLIWGLLTWSAWFVLIYAAQALSCTDASPEAWRGITTLNGGLIALGLAVAASLAYCGWRCGRAARNVSLPATDRFIAMAAALLYGSSAFSVLFVGLPLWHLPPCL